MTNYTVTIKTTNETRIYTTKAFSHAEAMLNAGRAFRMAGNNTDDIVEILVRES